MVKYITTREILENTEFSELIEPFEKAGFDELQKFIVHHNNGKLLDLLKDFEPDNERKYRLHNLLIESISGTSAFAIKSVATIGIILLVMFLIALLSIL